MLNIGLVGCGKWGLKILNEIERNKNFNLKSLACRNYNNKAIILKNEIEIHNNIENFFSQNSIDCAYIASIPEINLKAVKLAKKNKTPLILEKPISNNYENARKIQSIADQSKIIILPNLTNYFSESFFYLKNYIDENFYEIKKIIVYEGDNGPFRKNIHPIWDWGFHSFSTLNKIFENKKFSIIKKKEIKKNHIDNNGIISRFSFNVDSKFEVKLVNGNLFKKKIRKVKIFLKNKNILESDMINHKIYLNKKKVFENDKSPVQSLLNNFHRVIEEKNTDFSQNLIKISCKTSKMLEKFYKC